ncbi:hypothetical protein ANO11243_097480 [Dothideomycetidae sp. 11243]|nr:hypothetical protein ANO11243_097480 [fungal sp. No.11243]
MAAQPGPPGQSDPSTQPSDLLHYLEEYKVLICTSCQYALQPDAISRHLKDIHHILRSSRRSYMDYASGFALADAETVMHSGQALTSFPVPLLPVHDGLKCTHADCGHLCVTEKRMRSHWVTQHGRAGQSESDWNPVQLQTFFRGNSLRYFTAPPPALAIAQSLQPQAQSAADVALSQSQTQTQPQSPTLSLPLLSGSLSPTEQDDFLLQHYINSTSVTLASGHDIPAGAAYESYYHPLGAGITIWQTIIPQFAERHEFLMHGILACAALHLAHLNPQDRQTHLLTSAKHQGRAIPLFREAVAHLDAANCDAVLALVHIQTICSFASHRENERLLLVDPQSADILCDWLLFMRTGCKFVAGVRPLLMQGPLRSLICDWKNPIDPENEPYTPLVAQLLTAVPARDHADAWSDEECRVYRNAVYELGYAIARADRLGPDFGTWDALRGWPIPLSNNYLQLLRQLHPGALIVLAHYCILLHRLEGKWYFKGRAQRLSGHIRQRLDPKWHAHVQWL